MPSPEGTQLERARRHLRKRDRKLATVIRRAGPCAMEQRGDPYRALVRSVLFQQLAGSAARAIEGRLKASYGGRYPKAEVLARARPSRLRAAGLSRQKIESVRGVARAFADGTLSSRRLRRMDDDAVVEAVTQVKGIGEWTAHMLLMFSLGRLDVLPVGDYGVRKGARRLYGLGDLPDRAQLQEIGECWRPYRSVASWYLWRVEDLTSPE